MTSHAVVTNNIILQLVVGYYPNEPSGIGSLLAGLTEWACGDLPISLSSPPSPLPSIIITVFATPSLPTTLSHHKTEMGDERKVQIKKGESKQGVRKLLGVDSEKYDLDWSIFEVGLPRISS